MRVVPSVSKSQMFLWQHHLNMCVRLHMDSCIYIYIQTRDIDMQHYVPYIYIYNRIVIHAYISYIYISRTYKRYYWQSSQVYCICITLFACPGSPRALRHQRRCNSSVPTSQHALLRYLWWDMVSPSWCSVQSPGKMLGIAGVKKLKTGLRSRKAKAWSALILLIQSCIGANSPYGYGWESHIIEYPQQNMMVDCPNNGFCCLLV